MKTPNVRITMERYPYSDSKGWKFSITSINDDTKETETKRYRTNPDGDGLWAYMPSGAWYPEDGSSVMEYKQIRGICQFWLPTDRKRAYDKIRYHFAREDQS